MKILVTGGLGFIGSHTVVELANEGIEPIIVDNLYNSKEEVLEKLEKITGKKFNLYKYDLTEKENIEYLMKMKLMQLYILLDIRQWENLLKIH